MYMHVYYVITMITNLFRYKLKLTSSLPSFLPTLSFTQQTNKCTLIIIIIPSNSESVPNPSITTNHLSPTTNKSETNRRPPNRRPPMANLLWHPLSFSPPFSFFAFLFSSFFLSPRSSPCAFTSFLLYTPFPALLSALSPLPYVCLFVLRVIAILFIYFIHPFVLFVFMFFMFSCFDTVHSLSFSPSSKNHSSGHGCTRLVSSFTYLPIYPFIHLFYLV